MSIETTALSGALGVRISGVDLSQPMDHKTAQEVYAAFVQHKVIAFSNQSISSAELIQFSKSFGPLDVHSNSDYLLDGFPEILILSNDLKDGQPIGVVDAGVEWHSDLSWQLDPPLGSILHCLTTPTTGGRTGFLNMSAAYQLLPKSLQERLLSLEGSHCVSKLVNSRVTISENRVNAAAFYAEQLKKHPPVSHPMVYEHPDTGEKILFASPRFTIGIDGLDEEEGQSLLDEIFAYFDDETIRYDYSWSEGDIVMWDNRSVLHCALGGYQYPDIRLIHRTTVLCDDATRLRPVASL